MTTQLPATLYVFCGTAAEYLKLAPVLRELDRRAMSYRLIDSGQHHVSAAAVRRQLGIRDPDVQLGSGYEVSSVPQALRWIGGLVPVLLSKRRRAKLFGSTRSRGICLIHGDTVSTLLAALIARRARLDIAHVESGLRSHSLVHPFPEEIVRILVMRRASLLFAPDEVAVRNLEKMRVTGRIVAVEANTMAESLQASLVDTSKLAGQGPVVMTLHRVENLHRKRRRDGFVQLALTIQRRWGAMVVLHPATQAKLHSTNQLQALKDAGVALRSTLAHQDFVAELANAPFVVTDGGSIQEETAALGIPCLLWRQRTERPDGLGRSAVLSRHDDAVVAKFLEEFPALRQTPQDLTVKPSEQIVDELSVALARIRPE